MLRVSRLADYASVVMTCLARRPREVLSAVQIAEDARLELPTVSKLLKQLGHAGLVESFRGASGGYRLTRAPAQINLAEIVEALDGPIGLTECSAGHAGCEREAYCDISRAWQGIGSAFDAALRDVSLADMLRPRAQPRRVAVRSHVGAA
ncbi:MAG: SUF system Fe-S cluster assembly regulator [Rhodanobacteraceae bacterium]|nr:SUF system Fe-S cluster assembly regulator [Pseudomonadota bacterium]